MTHTQGLESRYRKHGESVLIELKLRDVMQLFNSLDPSPFHEKDLDDDAAEYIVGTAQEFPLRTPLRLHVHVPPEAATKKSSENVGEAIRNFFENRTEVADRELRQKFRQGSASLVRIAVFIHLHQRAGADRSDRRRHAPRHRPGGLAHQRLGGNVAADSGLPLRLVADSPSAPAFSQAESFEGGGPPDGLIRTQCRDGLTWINVRSGGYV